METNNINSFLVLITGDIDNFMYTYILVALLVFTGIYFTIRTKGVQFRYIKDMFTQLFEKKVDKNGKAISSFQAMMVSTGSRVGTGNIAGIATALAMGGPGALFWMWVMALIGGASAFIESTLAQIFKIRGKDGQFRGGPAYYIQQGLGKRWMGIVFAVSLIACYVVGFNELQAYNAASGLEYYIPDYATNGAAVVLGVVFTIATAAVIFGGQKRISVINSWVVPIMALAYIGLGVWITFSHLNLLPAAFGMMFASAFDFQAIFGGFAGSALMLGIKRGLFSNEAGDELTGAPTFSSRSFSAFIVGVACEAKGRTSSSILAASSSAARSTRISISAASRSWSSLGEVVAGAALTGGSGVFFVASSMALSATCSLFAKGLLAAS